MKKILSGTVLVLLFNFSAKSQDAVMGTSSFGIYGGINFQNINGKDDNGNKLENSLVTRFHVGIDEEIPIAPEFYFKFGLQYMGKGTKGTMLYDGRPVIRELNLSYIEIPLNLVFKPMLGTGKLVLGLGPYLGYAIAGKAKMSGDLYSGPAEQKIDFTKTAAPSDSNNVFSFRPLDVGANLFVGYQFANGFNIIFNSQLGLININSDYSSPRTGSKLANKNTGFGLSVGYRF